MKLYLIHCGFTDRSVGGGAYESHTNFFLVAEDFADAKLKVRALPEYKKLGMHIDGMQEIEAVEGYSITLKKSVRLKGESVIHLKNPWTR